MISVKLINLAGMRQGQLVPEAAQDLELGQRELLAVSDDLARLSCLTRLELFRNAFETLPVGVFALAELAILASYSNRLKSVAGIGRLTGLRTLWLNNNQLLSVPREIGQLSKLEWLTLGDNKLTSLPSEIGRLTLLDKLWIQSNRLTWLPVSFDRLPRSTHIWASNNPLPSVPVGGGVRSELPQLLAVMTALGTIRDEATTIAIGLQDLELPALVTLEIIDAAFANSIPMHKKWDLVVAK